MKILASHPGKFWEKSFGVQVEPLPPNELPWEFVQHGLRITVTNEPQFQKISCEHRNLVLPASELSTKKCDASYILEGDEGISLATADCVPLVLWIHQAEFKMACLIHAGWRGYALGIQQQALRQMAFQASQDIYELKPENIHAWIGPSIFGESYPCDQDVADALAAHLQGRHGESTEKLWLAEQNFQTWQDAKFFPDIGGLMACDLLALQLKNMTVVRANTFDHPHLASYRRDRSQQKEGKTRFFTNVSWL